MLRCRGQIEPHPRPHAACSAAPALVLSGVSSSAGSSDYVVPVATDLPDHVEIRRSARRRRTVSARVEGKRVVVLMPQGLSAAAERRHVEELLAGLERRQARRELREDDLLTRARDLVTRYLGPDSPAATAECTSVRWVTNQHTRWGSCTSSAGTIRISDRLRTAPTWVQDAVLIHEWVHLNHPDHGPAFRALVARYPRYEEAQSFLSGASWAAGWPSSDRHH